MKVCTDHLPHENETKHQSEKQTSDTLDVKLYEYIVRPHAFMTGLQEPLRIQKQEPILMQQSITADTVLRWRAAYSCIAAVCESNPDMKPVHPSEWNSDVELHESIARSNSYIGDLQGPLRIRRQETALVRQLFAMRSMKSPNKRGLFLSLCACTGVNIHPCAASTWVEFLTVSGPRPVARLKQRDLSLLWNDDVTDDSPAKNMSDAQFKHSVESTRIHNDNVNNARFTRGVYRVDEEMLPLIHAVYVLTHRSLLLNFCTVNKDSGEDEATFCLDEYNNCAKEVLLFIHSDIIEKVIRANSPQGGIN